MKATWTAAALLALAVVFYGAQVPAPPDDAVAEAPAVSVTFDSVVDWSAIHPRHGFFLDGSVAFYFADESKTATGDDISARGSTFGSDDIACRKALAAAFLSFQERAHREGYNAVLDVRTYAHSNVVGRSRDACLCRAGHRVYTTVRGRLAMVGK
jgi:hypothetical protein